MEETIEIELYKPHPDMNGYLCLDRRRTIGEVWKDLEKRLKAKGLLDGIEYFGVYPGCAGTTEPFPKYNHIACFAVRGGSEGYYIHVEALHEDKRTLIYLGKIIGGDYNGASGLEYAMLLANECTRALCE